jgi:hypothetical protein
MLITGFNRFSGFPQTFSHSCAVSRLDARPDERGDWKTSTDGGLFPGGIKSYFATLEALPEVFSSYGIDQLGHAVFLQHAERKMYLHHVECHNAQQRIRTYQKENKRRFLRELHKAASSAVATMAAVFRDYETAKGLELLFGGQAFWNYFAPKVRTYLWDFREYANFAFLASRNLTSYEDPQWYDLFSKPGFIRQYIEMTCAASLDFDTITPALQRLRLTGEFLYFGAVPALAVNSDSVIFQSFAAALYEAFREVAKLLSMLEYLLPVRLSSSRVRGVDQSDGAEDNLLYGRFHNFSSFATRETLSEDAIEYDFPNRWRLLDAAKFPKFRRDNRPRQSKPPYRVPQWWPGDVQQPGDAPAEPEPPFYTPDKIREPLGPPGQPREWGGGPPETPGASPFDKYLNPTNPGFNFPETIGFLGKVAPEVVREIISVPPDGGMGEGGIMRPKPLELPVSRIPKAIRFLSEEERAVIQASRTAVRWIRTGEEIVKVVVK